jgi:hypothetical protein
MCASQVAGTIAVWTYKQLSGDLSRDGAAAGACYSGYEAGKNNPAMQNVPNIGPVPQGRYTIGAPIDLGGGPHGPFVLPLTPDPANQMFGRFGFLIHGDSIANPGFASRGCIIAGLAIRQAIASSEDAELVVVE